MLNLSPFGLFHTVLGLAAVGAGIYAFIQQGKISHAITPGRIFIWMTVITCVTGLFIFHHGGFGKPHVLSIATLVVLGVAYWAELRQRRQAWARYLATASYSFAFFLHFIPGFTETLTRVPIGAPWASSPDDPKLAMLIGSAFLVFLAGLAFQLFRLRLSRTVALQKS